MAAFFRKFATLTGCMLLLTTGVAYGNDDLDALSAAQTKIQSLQQELQRIQTLSQDAIATESAYLRLREENELLKVEIETLKLDNIRLAEDNTARGIRWGMAAILLGVFLAWVIAQSATRKRRDQW